MQIATSSLTYHVQLENFEGPLDLLLHLIKENEIDIYNIPIAFITKQYLQYLETLKELNLDIAGEFLVMASTLAHIKSKTLLPQEASLDEDEEEGTDPREDLVRRLLEYQKYKNASLELEQLPVLGRNVFIRTVKNSKVKVPNHERELAEISIYKLLDAFHRVVKKVELANSYHQVDLEPIALQECIYDVHSAITTSKEGSVVFDRLFHRASTKLRVVVTFLAILDLMKRGYLRIFQANTFSEIQVMGTEQIYNNWEYQGEDEYDGPTTN